MQQWTNCESIISTIKEYSLFFRFFVRNNSISTSVSLVRAITHVINES